MKPAFGRRAVDSKTWIPRGTEDVTVISREQFALLHWTAAYCASDEFPCDVEHAELEGADQKCANTEEASADIWPLAGLCLIEGDLVFPGPVERNKRTTKIRLKNLSNSRGNQI